MLKKSNLRFELLMDAGNGAQKAGDILIKAFAKKGVFVFIEPIIPAEISPPKRTPFSLSGAVIRLSDNDITNIGSSSDYVLVEHEILLERRLQDQEFSDNCTIFLDLGSKKRAHDAYEAVEKKAADAGYTVIPFSISEDAEAIIKSLNGNGKNMYYLGVLARLFNVDREFLISFIEQTFKKLPKDKLESNIEIFNHGFDDNLIPDDQTIMLSEAVHETEKVLLDGNTALALGIIDSGIRFFSGYPITPASSIMHSLARLMPSYGGVLHQAEDEISAIGAVIGSYFGGVPAITATSGPGLSLKQEFIGLSVASEIPCIVVDVQRGGPSTGLPTRTEQTDLFAAIYGSHGDSPKVVISVANVDDCFYVPHVARYIAEVCRLPVIILSDYMISVSYRVVDRLKQSQLEDVNDIDDFVLDHFYMNRLPDTIEMVKENQDAPGIPDKMRRVTGLNTGVTGAIEYSADSNQRAHEVRSKKIHAIRHALKTPERFGHEKGDLLIVGWGSSRGAISEAVQSLNDAGHKVGGLHFKMVYPLPLNLREIFDSYRHVVTVEMAYGDALKSTPFSMMLRSETLCNVTCLISESKGRPLKPVYLIEKSLAFLKEVQHV